MTHQAEAWRTWVRELLGQGLGVEDIAAATKCSPDAVRREVRALRDAGDLTKLYDGTARTTAPKETPHA